MILVLEEEGHVNLVLLMADLQALHMGLNPAAVVLVPLLADLRALTLLVDLKTLDRWLILVPKELYSAAAAVERLASLELVQSDAFSFTITKFTMSERY